MRGEKGKRLVENKEEETLSNHDGQSWMANFEIVEPHALLSVESSILHESHQIS